MSERNFRGGARRAWHEDEVCYVLGNCDHMSDAELAGELTRITGRPVTAIAVKEVREMELGIRKGRDGRIVPTPFYLRPRR